MLAPMGGGVIGHQRLSHGCDTPQLKVDAIFYALILAVHQTIVFEGAISIIFRIGQRQEARVPLSPSDCAQL